LQYIKPEDTIIILDASRSMLRRDFKPNRLTVAIEAVKNFIQAKYIIDPKDRIGIITLGEMTRKICSITSDEQTLLNSLSKIEISGGNGLKDALSFAIQLLIEEMRKIGGKNYRIFIISDNHLTIPLNIEKLLDISKGLGIFIDLCQLGKITEFNENMLRIITDTTGGEFGFFNNSKAAYIGGKSFASKKEVKTSSDFFAPNKNVELTPLINEIALNLRRPSLLDIKLMMNDKEKGQDKCQICHSIKSPITKVDFYSEGRYCPSCDRPMHLSCAAMWAKKSEHDGNIFRCPFCYFLLEIPPSIGKIMDDAYERDTKVQIISENPNKTTRMILVQENYVSSIDASCTYCHSIFLNDFKVFRCEKCGSYYHEPCLEKMNDEIKACRSCGSKIIHK
jgi:hypothetical protein